MDHGKWFASIPSVKIMMLTMWQGHFRELPFPLPFHGEDARTETMVQYCCQFSIYMQICSHSTSLSPIQVKQTSMHPLLRTGTCTGDPTSQHPEHLSCARCCKILNQIVTTIALPPHPFRCPGRSPIPSTDMLLARRIFFFLSCLLLKPRRRVTSPKLLEVMRGRLNFDLKLSSNAAFVCWTFLTKHHKIMLTHSSAEYMLGNYCLSTIIHEFWYRNTYVYINSYID